MGIPSFYRHLCRKYPDIITSNVDQTDWLCLDFNCAMYFKLHQMPPYEGSVVGKQRWEAKLRASICDYMEEIIKVANPTAGVYVSCDGVVCAAKRMQQRQRRFKGPWITGIEDQIRGTCKERWDQNALTPGTAFMGKLGKDLEAKGIFLSKELGIPIQISTTAEPGEGEHKLMRHMRSLDASCTIYGLDADLILLAMLLASEKGTNVFLLREAQEFEKSVGWRTVNIRGFTAALFETTTKLVSEKTKVDDFVAAMSLLGNDFLPKSLTHTVREDGIPGLLRIINSRLWVLKQNLIVESAISRDSLLKVVAALAAEEEENLKVACVQAIRARNRSVFGDSQEDLAVAEWSATPGRNPKILEVYDNSRRALRHNWKVTYKGWRSDGPAKDYWKGLAWVFNYYKGAPVDIGWDYRPSLPPLWSDLAHALSVYTGPIRPPTIKYDVYLPDWIHLLAVLPEASAKRLLKANQLTLLKEKPELWPATFELFTVGASQIWQCEAMIPIISEETLRGLQNLTS